WDAIRTDPYPRHHADGRLVEKQSCAWSGHDGICNGVPGLAWAGKVHRRVPDAEWILAGQPPPDGLGSRWPGDRHRLFPADYAESIFRTDAANLACCRSETPGIPDHDPADRSHYLARFVPAENHRNVRSRSHRDQSEKRR